MPARYTPAMRRHTTPALLLLLVLGCPPAPGDTTSDATTGDTSASDATTTTDATTDALSTYGASETSVFGSTTSAPVDITTTDPSTDAGTTGGDATGDASASTGETTGEAICDGAPGTVFGPCISDACAPGLLCIMSSIGNVCAEPCDNVGCPSECSGSGCGPTGACLLFCDDTVACPVGMTCDNPFCVWPA